MTIQQLRDVYINNRSTYCSTDTILKYTDDLDLFFRFLESHYRVDPAVSSFDALTGSIYMDFILELRTRKIKNSSIRSYCRSVKAFLHWTYENNFSPDYLKGVKLPKADAVAELPLFVDDVRKIDDLFDWNTLQGLRNYCIFHLLLDCGLRRQEVCHLQVHHLDPERNILHLVNSKEKKYIMKNME